MGIEQCDNHFQVIRIFHMSREIYLSADCESALARAEFRYKERRLSVKDNLRASDRKSQLTAWSVSCQYIIIPDILLQSVAGSKEPCAGCLHSKVVVAVCH